MLRVSRDAVQVILGGMTTAVRTGAPPRSGPAIRALLVQWAPAEVPRFEVEFRQALDEAGRSFDVEPVHMVLERWRRLAVVRANPLTEEEQELLRRVRAGDDTGLWEQAEDGTFHRIG